MSAALHGVDAFRENLDRRLLAEKKFLQNDANKILQRAIVARHRVHLDWQPG